MPVSVIPVSVIPDSTLARYNQFRYTRFPLATPPSVHLVRSLDGGDRGCRAPQLCAFVAASFATRGRCLESIDTSDASSIVGGMRIQSNRETFHPKSRKTSKGVCSRKMDIGKERIAVLRFISSRPLSLIREARQKERYY